MGDLEHSGEGDGGHPLPSQRHFRFWIFLPFIFFVVAGLLIAWSELVVVPNDFPVGQVVNIPPGASLRTIATELEGEHVIRSQTAFALMVKSRAAESHLVAGDYLFPSALSLTEVVDRLTEGDHGIARVRVTLPEGTSIAGMGRIFQKTFPKFDNAQFTLLTKGSEGYLFPDTYFFLATATSGPIVDMLQKNFVEKTASLHTEANANKQSWSDTIIMASIIEEEATTPADRRIISGILWKRLATHMHLQVDSPFAYAIGKNSATLTVSDLNLDSPYNTYRYGGLPPTPISNPGLDAIDAALHPQASPYLYYLSGPDGVMHYAKTFEEHKLNKVRYLR